MSTWARSNIRFALLAGVLAVAHVVVRHFQPAFCPPYSGKALWIRLGLKTEVGLHILFLGLILTAMKRALPSIDTPETEPEVLSLFPENGTPRRDEVKWGRVLLLLLEGSLYAGVWVTIWGNRV